MHSILNKCIEGVQYAVNMPAGYTGKLLNTQLSLKKPFRINPLNKKKPTATIFSL